MPAPVPSSAGQSVLDVLHCLRELVGAATVDRALASLASDDQEAFRALTPVTWIPVEVVGRMVDAVGREAGRDPDALLAVAVRMATERTLKTVWRILLRVTTDEALVSRTPLLYAKSRNVGRLEVQSVQRGRAELRLSGWPTVSDRHLRSLGVSIETILGLAGRQGARVFFRREPDGASFTLTWTARGG